VKAFSQFPCILLSRQPIDFRKGRKSIAAWVRAVMNENPFDETLYVFVNKRKDCIKVLYWSKTGFALWEKGLEKERFPWPKSLAVDKIVITHQQAEWLLDGIDIWKLKPHSELHYSSVV